MRYLIAAGLVCGCSGSSGAPADATDAPRDAPACGDVRPTTAAPDCVEGGLGAIDINGTWTLTGTFVDFDGFRRDFTTAAMLGRNGTGNCAFGLRYMMQFDSNRSFMFAADSDPTTYVDDNVAFAGANVICALADGSLKLRYTVSMTVGEGPLIRTITGALTR